MLPLGEEKKWKKLKVTQLIESFMISLEICCFRLYFVWFLRGKRNFFYSSQRIWIIQISTPNGNENTNHVKLFPSKTYKLLNSILQYVFYHNFFAGCWLLCSIVLSVVFYVGMCVHMYGGNKEYSLMKFLEIHCYSLQRNILHQFELPLSFNSNKNAAKNYSSAFLRFFPPPPSSSN